MSLAENKDKDTNIDADIGNKNIEDNIDFIEFLTTEREGDTNFGRFLARTNKRSFQFLDFAQNAISFVMVLLRWFTDNLFTITFSFVTILVAIAYITQKLTLF